MKFTTNLYRSLLVFLLLSVVFAAFAQSGGGYAMKKNTINNGGGRSSGGSFAINVSIGQVDASTEMNGGAFSLTGGFWSPDGDLIFTNGFE